MLQKDALMASVCTMNSRCKGDAQKLFKNVLYYQEINGMVCV